jgi:hypothetical protein
VSRGDGLARLRQALEEHGCAIRGNNAQCPAHEDREPSLSIGQGREGAVLNCHRDCEPDAVLEALGMSAADLFDEPRAQDRGPGFQVMATYTYTDESGAPLFFAERRIPKAFRQYHVRDGQKIWNLQGVRRVLYRLPQVIEAVKNGQTIYIAEGEKDVHAIEAAGGVATCNPMGAGKWRDEYAAVLAGAAAVVIVADRDDAGRKHAAQIAASLGGVAASVTVAEAAEGKDVADHLAAGLGLGELRPAGEAPTRLDVLRRALLDSDGLDNLPAPEPLIDGLLYRDSLAWLHGKPGHGKSLLALDWACCIAAGLPWLRRPVTGGAVLYVIAEGATGLRARVRAWEDRAGLKTAVRFLPVAVQLLQLGEPEAVAALAAELACALVVLDTQARMSVGADENSSQDMGRLVEAADKIRMASGACVQLVHHEARAGDNMRGSTALEGAATTILRAVKDGSRLELTNPKQKDAAEADPVTLWVVPRLQSVVIAGKPDSPTLDLRADSENKILKALLDLFGTTGAAATTLREATGLSKSTFHWALNRLVKDGLVQNLGSRTRTCYALAQVALPAEVQQVQQGPSPTGPMSNGVTRGNAIGRAPLDHWPEGSQGAEAQAAL